MTPNEPLPFGTLLPEQLFGDITYIHDAETVRRIQNHCIAHGCVADIPFDDEHQEWVWHTLYLRGKTVIEKEVAARFVPSAVPPREREAALLADVAAFLEANGVHVDRQVVCATGIADLVTRDRDAVFEVKYWLTRANLFCALGQVLLYRQAINPAARAIIVGRSTGETVALQPSLEQLGIELMLWPQSGNEARDT